MKNVTINISGGNNNFSDSPQIINQSVFINVESTATTMKESGPDDTVDVPFEEANTSCSPQSTEESNHKFPEQKSNESSKFRRLGPPIAFRDLDIDRLLYAVKMLRNAISAYIECSEEDFLFLMIPDCTTSRQYQPVINWTSGSQRDMKACFHELYENSILNDNQACYKYNNKPIHLSKDWADKDRASYEKKDHTDWKQIIEDCCHQAIKTSYKQDYSK